MSSIVNHLEEAGRQDAREEWATFTDPHTAFLRSIDSASQDPAMGHEDECPVCGAQVSEVSRGNDYDSYCGQCGWRDCWCDDMVQRARQRLAEAGL